MSLEPWGGRASLTNYCKRNITKNPQKQIAGFDRQEKIARFSRFGTIVGVRLTRSSNGKNLLDAAKFSGQTYDHEPLHAMKMRRTCGFVNLVKVWSL